MFFEFQDSYVLCVYFIKMSYEHSISFSHIAVSDYATHLVSNFLHTPIARTTPSVLLDNISFRDVIQPQANRGNYDTEILKQAENDNTKYTI